MLNKIITKQQALDLLPDGEDIHTFKNCAFGLMGCDCSRERIAEIIESADDIQLTGEQAKALNHGMVAFPPNAKYQSDLVFIETDKDKLAAFDSDSEDEL